MSSAAAASIPATPAPPFTGSGMRLLSAIRAHASFFLSATRKSFSTPSQRPSLATAAVYAYLLLFAIAAILDNLDPGFATRNTPRLRVKAGVEPTAGQCLARGMMERQFGVHSVSLLKEYFDCGCRGPDVYESHENPRVCAVVQSFNHARNIAAISKALVENPSIDEVVICEDGSTDDSLDLWVAHLRGLKHFVVVSNNLHEVRCYNRAMRMSSADFFVLLQDDDLPGALAVTDVKAAGDPAALQDKPGEELPKRNWVKDGLELMDADPSLGLLSGFIGQLWDETGKGYEFGEQQSDHGGLRPGPTRRIPFVSRQTRRPFMYVESAWIAPLLIRSTVLRRVGGLDVDVFEVGQPGMWQDILLSYATWAAGWRVGVYDAMFERGVGGHGSASTPEKARMRDTMWKKAKAVVDGRFERGFVREHVVQLNNRTLDWRYVMS